MLSLTARCAKVQRSLNRAAQGPSPGHATGNMHGYIGQLLTFSASPADRGRTAPAFKQVKVLLPVPQDGDLAAQPPAGAQPNVLANLLCSDSNRWSAVLSVLRRCLWISQTISMMCCLPKQALHRFRLQLFHTGCGDECGKSHLTSMYRANQDFPSPGFPLMTACAKPSFFSSSSFSYKAM